MKQVLPLSLAMMLVAISALVSGCATPMHEQAKKVKVGMEKHDVLELMGNPISVKRVSGKDKWTYIFYVNNKRQGLDVVFDLGNVVAVTKAKLKPSREQLLKESTTIEEYESHLQKDAPVDNSSESQFKDID